MTNLSLAAMPAATASSETTDFSSAKISNGFGLLTKAGVSVQKGVTANFVVNINVLTLTQNSVTKWLKENQSSFSKSEWATLQEGSRTSGAFGWLFGGNKDSYKNQSNKVVSASNSKEQGFLKTLHQQQMSNVNISGTLQAVGTSFIPVEGFVFTEVTTIEFNDNTKMHVINTSSPVVADQNGNTNNIESKGGKLNVVPLS